MNLYACRPSDITDEEYDEFYKSFSKDTDTPMAKTHFTAEGEVTFKSVLFVPKTSPQDMFQNYGKKLDYIKMYVRRVFITDNFEDMMPKYLSFVRGVVSRLCRILVPFSFESDSTFPELAIDIRLLLCDNSH